MKELTKIIPSLTPLHKAIMGLILLMMFAYGLNTLVAKPEQKKLADKKIQVANIQNQLRLRQAQSAASHRRAKARGSLTADLENQLASVNNRVYRPEEMAGVMDEIRGLVAKNGGRNFKFQQEHIVESVVSLNAGRDSFAVQRLPVRMSFTARYNEVQETLSKIREAGQFISIDRVDLSSKGDTAVLQARLSLSLYYVKNEG